MKQTIRSYADVKDVQDNVVHLREAPGGKFVNSSITFEGTGNVLYIEDGARLEGTRLMFLGNGAVIHLRASRRPTRVTVRVYHQSVFYLGPGASFTAMARFQPTERKHVIIGRDAMFSSGVTFRTADPHLVYSAETHRRINNSASIWIGDHVWIGQEVLCLKGARIGSGSILAARSVVTKGVSSNSTAAGAPARVVGSDVFWTRPTVHGYTKEQSQASQIDTRREFVFDEDGAVDIRELEAELDGAADAAARAEWCYRLDDLQAKNRFYQP